MKYILGVDAAWSIKNPSGVALIRCALDQPPELIRVGRSYEEFAVGQINWATKVSGSMPNFPELLKDLPRVNIVAIDIPLAPVPIVGRREVDQAISRKYGKYKATTHSPTGDRPGKIASAIFKQLTDLGYKWATEYAPSDAFFEVYPHASIIELFHYRERLCYKVGKKSKYWPQDSAKERTVKLIANLNELRDNLTSVITQVEKFIPKINIKSHYPIAYLKGYEDLLDALVCALTGYFYIQGKIKPLGDQTGVAWVPTIM